jgi:hypothetical protein
VDLNPLCGMGLDNYQCTLLKLVVGPLNLRIVMSICCKLFQMAPTKEAGSQKLNSAQLPLNTNELKYIFSRFKNYKTHFEVTCNKKYRKYAKTFPMK